ncbi:MAG: chorismate synthase [Phototrophicaceae bacterium]
MPQVRFFTAGESHGPMLTAILEGMPAGLPLEQSDIDDELARRQTGYGAGGRMSIEKDSAYITAGLMNGLTTGAPIALTLENRDFKNWKEKDIAPITTPRPGHADLTGAVKYGYRELRLSLERASARETAARVAVGAICKKFLRTFGIEVYAYVTQIGDVQATVDYSKSFAELYQTSLENELRTPDENAVEPMREKIKTVRKDQDTLGGVWEIVAVGVPPGLGSHVQWDRKLDGRIAQVMMSIHAMKGVEIGEAFANAAKSGSQVHDEIFLNEATGELYRTTNRAGGLEGGITTGEPIVVRLAMKPIATVLKALGSVNLASGQPEPTTYERSDFCALPRAMPIGEAMLAIVLADALTEKLGGDSIEEMQPRFAQLKRNRLTDLPMDNAPWRFGYE